MVDHKMEDDEVDMSDRDDNADDNKHIIRRRSSFIVSSSRPLRGKKTWKPVDRLLTQATYSTKPGPVNVRLENRARLRELLRRLVAGHNWVDASGSLSILLRGTLKERSPQSNRMKYWIAMELLQHMESDPDAYSKRIDQLYGAWREKIKSHGRWPTKDRSVMLEYILSCLVRNNHDSARNNLRSLQEERESARDPRSNLVLGLTNYEFWYCSLPKDMKCGNLEESCMHMESETVQSCYSAEINNLKGEDAASIFEKFSNPDYHSETSVVNDEDKDAYFCKGEVSETSPAKHFPEVHSQEFYMRSVETGENDGSMQNDYDQYQCSSAYNVHGLQSLVPIKMLSSEDTMDVISSRRRYFGEDYKEALKYLKLAHQSPPPISEAALLPLIQLLLVSGQAKEAMAVLEKSCNNSCSVLPFRLKARLLECYDPYHYDRISVCFEDVMKKDPTCTFSLGRLRDLHQKGKYAPERLMEMIALHLEATYGDYILWRDFALCLLKILQCEDDRMSTCVDQKDVKSEQMHTIHFYRTPALFMDGASGKTWRFRCKWWLNRHFSKHILASEMEKGDVQSMSYKAACASHLYGPKLDYVMKVHAYVNEEVDKLDRSLVSFLRTHIQNSVGYFSDFIRN